MGYRKDVIRYKHTLPVNIIMDACHHGNLIAHHKIHTIKFVSAKATGKLKILGFENFNLAKEVSNEIDSTLLMSGNMGNTWKDSAWISKISDRVYQVITDKIIRKLDLKRKKKVEDIYKNVRVYYSIQSDKIYISPEEKLTAQEFIKINNNTEIIHNSIYCIDFDGIDFSSIEKLEDLNNLINNAPGLTELKLPKLPDCIDLSKYTPSEVKCVLTLKCDNLFTDNIYIDNKYIKDICKSNSGTQIREPWDSGTLG